MRVLLFKRRLSMYPIITIFGKEIGTYAIFVLIGAFAAGLFAIRNYYKLGRKNDLMLCACLFAAIGVFIGGHLLYALTNISLIIEMGRHLFQYDSFKTFLIDLGICFGGMVFYGGLLGGLFAVYLYFKKKKENSAVLFDVLTPSIPLFHAFGRIGCFFGGCCYGVPCEIGFTYTNSPSEAANYIKRFPIQLCEAAFNFLLCLFLYVLLKKHKMRGRLLFLYFTLYAVWRFFAEFYRGDEIRGFLWGLSTSQWISILLLVGSLIVFLRDRMLINRRKEQNERYSN